MKSIKKIAKTLVASVLSAGLLAVLVVYLQYRQDFPSTDDAYVQAEVARIATQINGQLSAIYVEDNQHVTKGQVLLNIDPRPYLAALEKSNAEFRLAKQKTAANKAAVEIAQARLAKAKAEFLSREQHFKRIKKLVDKKQASLSSGDDAKADLDGTHAALQAAQSQLVQAREVLGDETQVNAAEQQAQAMLQTAQLNLQYTHITAPADGYVTKLTVRNGSIVNAGTPLFYLIEDNSYWVEANYKESQLTYIKPGQLADVTIDMYPNKHFKGVVQSISYGSGAAFSLLPPENATGNWVKVIQRFPIKITVMADPAHPLRVGASSQVKIDTKRGLNRFYAKR